MSQPRVPGRLSCVISGGSSGIGLATGRLLASRGVDLVVVDREPPPDDLSAVFVPGDVRKQDTWRAAAAAWDGSFGGLDFAFLNAGIQSAPGALVETERTQWQNVLDVNLGGVIGGTFAVAQAMVTRGGGAIVLTSSLAGLLAYPPDPVYAATKHGVVGFGRAAAHRFESDGIRVNVLCPGLTDTAFLTTEQRDDIDVEDFPLIPGVDVAAATVELLFGGETGGVWVCQYARSAIRYEPRGVPGPGNHRKPPASLSQPRSTNR